ncbi:hypothetical protein BpHYR1_028319 [Brachionus plicatilis]|uniref:Uncharacterized protein n=1 Tax=Brachionus plicatilis TaxID=10195 RepID=A0A3M7R3I9_BRAPC|nr:hypothetical protein BpHYR1_028319 [Brachionus plicatilis]
MYANAELIIFEFLHIFLAGLECYPFSLIGNKKITVWLKNLEILIIYKTSIARSYGPTDTFASLNQFGELWFIYYWINSCSQLGREDKFFEIDESMFHKVKHLKGKYLSRVRIWFTFTCTKKLDEPIVHRSREKKSFDNRGISSIQINK